MNIVIAPDSYKDCLNASQVASNIAEGIRRVKPDANINCIPLADGGEGFVQTMLSAVGGTQKTLMVKDPLGRTVEGFYGILNDQNTAIIEMAAASGIELLKPEERNPLLTSTYGTGQLMVDAIKNGCKRLVIGIGGSATNDGGTGMAKALGFRFLNHNDRELPEGGGALGSLNRIDSTKKLTAINDIEIIVACDVNNPLTGPRGATATYGPQKGATPDMVTMLDNHLGHLARIIKKDLNKDILDLEGGGAAGGIGAGLVAFANATLRKGFDIVKEQTNLEEHIKNSDLVITGEGKIDWQTKNGKTPWGVAQIAGKYNKPVIAIAGVLGKDYRDLYNEGFTSLFALPNGPATLDYCITNAPELLADTSEQIFRVMIRNL